MYFALTTELCPTPLIAAFAVEPEELMEQLCSLSPSGTLTGEEQAAIYEACRLPEVNQINGFGAQGLPVITIGKMQGIAGLVIYIQTIPEGEEEITV